MLYHRLDFCWEYMEVFFFLILLVGLVFTELHLSPIRNCVKQNTLKTRFSFGVSGVLDYVCREIQLGTCSAMT